MIISTGFDPNVPMFAKTMKAEAEHIFLVGGGYFTTSPYLLFEKKAARYN